MNHIEVSSKKQNYIEMCIYIYNILPHTYTCYDFSFK